jgi:type III secretory pathway component EscR
MLLFSTRTVTVGLRVFTTNTHFALVQLLMTIFITHQTTRSTTQRLNNQQLARTKKSSVYSFTTPTWHGRNTLSLKEYPCMMT